jgi:valyl-tRNA synthetase
MMVLREPPSECAQCASSNIRQDEDVLDTWFSSWLWPFSTQGWPQENADLKYFYPTDLLVTGPDIIFFWVARMIMAGLEFMDEIPFKDVLLNGIIRDEFGRKMSKSLGNGIDPLEMIEEYSADAVRFTLVILSSEGQDINLSRNSFEIGRNFSNKIWNAYRFLSMHLDEIDTDYQKYSDNFELSDRWILSSFHKTIAKCSSNLDRFRVNESLNDIYQFFWHDYCDWYLELIKKRLYQKDGSGSYQAALSIATYVLKESMSLLHPYIPFITEEIWQTLKIEDDHSIVVSSWPQSGPDMLDEESEKKMIFIQDAISALRNIRAEMNVPPGKTAGLYIHGPEAQLQLINDNVEYFQGLAKVDHIHPFSDQISEEAMASAVIDGVDFFLPLAELIDVEKERQRLEKEIQRLEGLAKSFSAKLANQSFLDKAPEKVVRSEQEKLANIKQNLDKVRTNYDKLQKKQ